MCRVGVEDPKLRDQVALRAAEIGMVRKRRGVAENARKCLLFPVPSS